jgi:hypothetical protein
MTKYRIVQVNPEGWRGAFVIQIKLDDKWQELSSIVYKAFHDSLTEAEATMINILEQNKWKATHGDYQVIREYD